MTPTKISKDSLIVFDRFGIQADFIDAQIERASEQISTAIHAELTDSEIFPDDEGSEDWMKDGRTCRVLEPGKNWQTGRLRFRIITEFILDMVEEQEIATKESEKSSDSSLDDIRNSIEPS